MKDCEFSRVTVQRILAFQGRYADKALGCSCESVFNIWPVLLAFSGILYYRDMKET